MKFLVYFFLILTEVFFSVSGQTDIVLDLIDEAGYKGEAHQVETEDGYLLKVHRLLTKSETSSKPPVFLQHGLFETSADYLMLGPKIALAYYLSDNGYDVWLGNARGNKHSMNHKTLSADSRDFWMFSWHEIGYYDLPAMIDYMLNVTNASKAFYVGHSQGGTSINVLLSTRPEYNDKIIQAHLMAPAVFMDHLPHGLFRELGNIMMREGLFLDHSYFHFEGHLDILRGFVKLFCNEKQSTKACVPLYFSILGKNRDKVEMDPHVMRIFFDFVSPRISVGQLYHFFQSTNSKKFRKYDFGKSKNLEIYNATSPPDYKLENFKVPAFIYCGETDALVSRPDLERLRDVLPNVEEYRFFTNWNHGDFLYGTSARKELYKHILQAFENQINESQGDN